MSDDPKVSTTVTRILELSRQDPSRLQQLEKFRRSVAILFTDIQGSTAYFEKYGDLAGLSMVHQCNSLLEDVVSKRGGRVIKNIGDAIMASFESCEQCVRTAVEMQQQLKEVNAGKKDEDCTRIRIGAHYGVGIVKSGDVFGDVVNVASRVQSLALPQQILVSDSLFKEVAACNLEIVPLGRFQLKGKSEEREIYEVRWNQSLPARTNLAHTIIASPTDQVQQFTLQHLTPAGKIDAEHLLVGDGLTIGRNEGDLKFPDDSSMSSPHARIFVHNGQPMVEDLSTQLGVFIRLKGVFTLEDRDIVIVGGQLLRFESKPEILGAATAMAVAVPDVTRALHEDAARFVRLNNDASDQQKYLSIMKDEMRFGRTSGDYTFPNDRFMSRTHARVYLRGENYFLEDLSSLNGTFAKVRGTSPIPVGTSIRVGREVFALV
ncbi:MAG: FHA domain-containing protein [Acidobacteriaceae bacterium]|nr:FHA domain-containing protein [Acidobacteriaceae bacterium]